jgi:hypothetical protein
MILIINAVYGLFCLAYVARPGRRAGAWLLSATLLLPFALIGAGLFDGNRESNRRIAEMRESTAKSLREIERTRIESRDRIFETLKMGAAYSDIGNSLGTGVEVSRSRIGEMETVGYVYDGRYALIFQGGRLVSKSRH